MSKNIRVNLLEISDKEKILKAHREKQHITKRAIMIQMTTDISCQKEWRPVDTGWTSWKCWKKKKNCQPGILYPAKNIHQIFRQNQDFFIQKKTKRICHQQSCTKEMLKEVLQAEEKLYQMKIWIFRKELRASKLTNIYKRVLKLSFKHIWLFKAKIITLPCIYNFCSCHMSDVI